MSPVAENPRAVIGGNNPPEIPDRSPTAIDRAKPIAEELGRFLSENPVLSNEDEVRAAKDIRDRFIQALKSMEEERDAKTRPLREEVANINGYYFRWHNPDKKRPALWDKLVNQLWSRMTTYALKLEVQKKEAARAATEAAEEAARIARDAEQREIEAATDAASGVCDVDIAAATEAADEAFSNYRLLEFKAERLEASASKVRITGGPGNAVSLKDHEILTVTDWRAAIEEIGLTEGIAAEIIKAARAYRKLTDQLPAGIEANYERGL